MTLEEIIGAIGDVVALPLPVHQILERLWERTNGATDKQLIVAALTALRDMAKRVIELTGELADLHDDYTRLAGDADAFEAELNEARRELDDAAGAP